jgi:hypothetical protein
MRPWSLNYPRPYKTERRITSPYPSCGVQPRYALGQSKWSQQHFVSWAVVSSCEPSPLPIKLKKKKHPAPWACVRPLSIYCVDFSCARTLSAMYRIYCHVPVRYLTVHTTVVCPYSIPPHAECVQTVRPLSTYCPIYVYVYIYIILYFQFSLAFYFVIQVVYISNH